MITVAICTANRGDRFKATLDSLAEQTLPTTDFEVLVAENGTRGNAEEIVKQFACSGALNARHFFLEAPGLSHARNFCVKEARGEILAFTDDDAKPDSRWLETILAAFQEDPDAAAAGGPVQLEFETPPPPWLTAQHRVLLVEYDLGDTKKDLLHSDELLRGVNMAFRRNVFEGGNVFSESLGRINNLLLSGEDTEIQQRLLDREVPIVYVPEARVVHCLRGDRMTPESFRERFYWQGITEARVARMRRGFGAQVLKALRCVGLMFKTEAAIAVSRMRNESGRIQLFSQFRSYPLGYLREFIRPVR